MPTYFITGAGGFIGRAVIARLAAQPGVKLRLLVRRSAAGEDFVKQGFEVVVVQKENP